MKEIQDQVDAEEDEAKKQVLLVELAARQAKLDSLTERFVVRLNNAACLCPILHINARRDSHRVAIPSIGSFIPCSCRRSSLWRLLSPVRRHGCRRFAAKMPRPPRPSPSTSRKGMPLGSTTTRGTIPRSSTQGRPLAAATSAPALITTKRAGAGDTRLVEGPPGAVVAGAATPSLNGRARSTRLQASVVAAAVPAGLTSRAGIAAPPALGMATPTPASMTSRWDSSPRLGMVAVAAGAVGVVEAGAATLTTVLVVAVAAVVATMIALLGGMGPLRQAVAWVARLSSTPLPARTATDRDHEACAPSLHVFASREKKKRPFQVFTMGSH